jgi:hypothetical protein
MNKHQQQQWRSFKKHVSDYSIGYVWGGVFLFLNVLLVLGVIK